MSRTGRPRKAEADPIIAAGVARGASLGDILLDLEAAGITVSHMTVARRMQALRAAAGVTSEPPPGYLSVDDAAQILGLSRQRVHLIRSRLGMRRDGRRVWLAEAAVRAYAAQQAGEHYPVVQHGGHDD